MIQKSTSLKNQRSSDPLRGQLGDHLRLGPVLLLLHLLLYYSRRRRSNFLRVASEKKQLKRRRRAASSSSLLLSSLPLSDAKLYEPSTRALLGTSSHSNPRARFASTGRRNGACGQVCIWVFFPVANRERLRAHTCTIWRNALIRKNCKYQPVIFKANLCSLENAGYEKSNQV